MRIAYLLECLRRPNFFAMLESASLIIFTYLLGSISSAILLSKIMGFEDPRSEGSKNPGATNVLRIAGKKAAVLTLIGDCLKGFIPVLIGQWLDAEQWVLAATLFAAFIGHCYPMYFGFQGGKGVATAIAGTVAFNWIIGAILIGIWLIIAKVFRISSLAAIIGFAGLPLLVLWFTQALIPTLIFVAISIILIWRHRGNIQRILAGTEG